MSTPPDDANKGSGTPKPEENPEDSVEREDSESIQKGSEPTQTAHDEVAELDERIPDERREEEEETVPEKSIGEEEDSNIRIEESEPSVDESEKVIAEDDSEVQETTGSEVEGTTEDIEHDQTEVPKEEAIEIPEEESTEVPEEINEKVSGVTEQEEAGEVFTDKEDMVEKTTKAVPKERSNLKKAILSIVFIIPLNFIMSMIQLYIFFNTGMDSYLPYYRDLNALVDPFINLGRFSYIFISSIFFFFYMVVVYIDARIHS